jgi:predicted Zn-dependent peptidase
LSNGLKVVLIPIKGKHNVSLNLAYRVGSKNEKKGRTGMAHLFEHLMFEGSKNLAKGEFDRNCTMAGGVNNAYTTYDYTAYTMTIPSNQLELGLFLESDRMLEFSVTEESMTTQQKVVSEEIRQTVFDSPYGRWREYLAESAYADDCSYSWEVHGLIEDVEAVNLNDLKLFFNDFYRPDNAVLTICGGFDSSNAFKLVDKYFGSITRSTLGAGILTFNDSFIQRNKSASFEDTVALPAVFLNYHFPGFMKDDVYIADIISMISSSGRSARLYNELIHKKQIASSVGAFVDKREGASLLTYYAIAQNNDIGLEELEKQLKIIVDGFGQEDVKDDELEKTSNQLTTQIALDIQYSSGLADIASSNIIFSEDTDRIYQVLDKYKSYGKKHIMKFANDYLNTDNEIRIYCLPKTNNSSEE